MVDSHLQEDPGTGLIRGLGLKEATAANVVEMLGIGPFITIPILIAEMGGPHAMLGWFLGAILAVCDGLVWAELGAAMPGAGGSYIYLREAYNPRKMGQMMSFLFVWMIFFTAPLSVATGTVGFAQYLRYLSPDLSDLTIQWIAVGLCLLVTFALYRGIKTIGRLSFILMLLAVGSILWVIVSGVASFRLELLLDIPEGAFSFSGDFFLGLGGAALIGIYGYGGYNNVCFLGGEVKNPSKNIPFAVDRGRTLSAGDFCALSRHQDDWSPLLHPDAVGGGQHPVGDCLRRGELQTRTPLGHPRGRFFFLGGLFPGTGGSGADRDLRLRGI